LYSLADGDDAQEERDGEEVHVGVALVELPRVVRPFLGMRDDRHLSTAVG
jgi:hypothetical protein